MCTRLDCHTFGFNAENADIDPHVKDELIDTQVCVDLETKSLFKSKSPSDSWSNVIYRC